MRIRPKGILALAAAAALPILSFAATPSAETRPSETTVEGVWRLEKIVQPTGSIETHGGFIFREGYYSTTVNFSQNGTETNISQFGTYALEGGRLALLPTVQVSTRGQTVIYEPEPPFSMEISIVGDEMKGVAQKDGTTFVFKRIH
jgi:hypothetical protein